jgi:Bacterial alpha-L-rhamnosidase 6 hairpin glycosidase domain
MKHPCFLLAILLPCLSVAAGETAVLSDGSSHASVIVTGTAGARTFTVSSDVRQRDNYFPSGRRELAEQNNQTFIETGNLLFDAFYALAVAEARENSVESIHDSAFNHGEPFRIHAFETGVRWPYVWTRDLAYSTHLGLASFDPERCATSLLFKTSSLKNSVAGGFTNQIIQDTGSGGSYPVSSDRAIWVLGASATLQFLDGAARENFLRQAWPCVRDTIEQDRALIFDPADGLYRGEQSFLDWREQTYPGWTKDNVLPIALSKAQSTCLAHYLLLRTGADMATHLGENAAAARYRQWAEQLKTAINKKFWDERSGMYSAYRLGELAETRVARHDLLGQCLAILSGVADEKQAAHILENYPTGPFGPPVVWPQEKSVPIYHNQAIWPFVTAYWLKAARVADHAEAASQALRSLLRGALLNLSNMENFDWVTGAAEAEVNGIKGPVINSQRQLWSVGAGLSAVQDALFGLETSWDGIRFRPFLPCAVRNEFSPRQKTLKLEHFHYRGKQINVTLHLPTSTAPTNGALVIAKTKLNGKVVGEDFVSAAELLVENQFEIWLENPHDAKPMAMRVVNNMSDTRSYFGPRQPQWIGPGVTPVNGRLTLRYECPGESNVVFNLYRDGECAASNVVANAWTDDRSTDFENRVHYYAVEAMYPDSGNVSQLAPTAGFVPERNRLSIPAAAMKNSGGELFGNDHFRNWGRSSDELVANLAPAQTGDYLLRVEYANGSGPINTGITCGVKRLAILDPAGRVLISAPLILPHTVDWNRYLLSSPVRAKLDGGEKYSVRIYEDETSRNMSYLAKNRIYTANPGGGDAPANFVDVRSLQIIRER